MEKGGKAVKPTEKQKGGNGGQVGGRVAVSEIRRVGGNLLTFWMKRIKLMQRMKTLGGASYGQEGTFA